MVEHYVTFRFGDFELDSAAYELRSKGRRIRLASQPMDVLLLLVERSGQLVPREDIRKRLWGDEVFVDVDAGIRTAVLKIRQALHDSGGTSRYLETVTGKGYRFVAPVATLPSATQSLRVQSVAALASDARPHNLPADLTSFVGRDRELGELRALLDTTRLLSLTGPGGVGKTRLATRLLSELTSTAPGGVWLIDLAPLTSPDQIVQAIAAVLGLRESPQRPLRGALADFLRDRELLLLFDTCEHAIGTCAEMAEGLLREARGLRIVATSREALSLPGETLYRVPPLSLPAPAAADAPADAGESEATRLFVERATAADRHFRASPEEMPAIVAVCRRLDGMPLAIELAAAQVATMSPSAIESRLQQQLGLTSATRTSVERQRTLDATVEWSHRLLTEPEQRLFARLSVFPESWTLEAASGTCSDEAKASDATGELVSRLAGKALVHCGSPGLHGSGRFRFLDPVRHYARQRLAAAGETNALRDRHFTFFYTEFRDGLHTLGGPHQARWLKLVQLEQENLRAALDWGLSSPPLEQRAVELAGALFWFWTKRGLFAEGRQWLERAAGVPAPPLLGGRVELGLAHMAYFQGRHADMVFHNDKALALGREAGDGFLETMALFGQGLAAFECGKFEEAAGHAHAAYEASQRQFTSPMLILGNIALVNGDAERALDLFQQAIDGIRRVGELWGLGILLSLAAGLRIVREDFDGARACASEALSIYRDLEDPRGLAWSLDVFAGLKAAAGRSEDAVRLWGASDSLLMRVGGTLAPTIGWIRDRYFDKARAALGQRSFERAHREGQALTLDSAVVVATRHVEPAPARRFPSASV